MDCFVSNGVIGPVLHVIFGIFVTRTIAHVRSIARASTPSTFVIPIFIDSVQIILLVRVWLVVLWVVEREELNVVRELVLQDVLLGCCAQVGRPHEEAGCCEASCFAEEDNRERVEYGVSELTLLP